MTLIVPYRLRELLHWYAGNLLQCSGFLALFGWEKIECRQENGRYRAGLVHLADTYRCAFPLHVLSGIRLWPSWWLSGTGFPVHPIIWLRSPVPGMTATEFYLSVDIIRSRSEEPSSILVEKLRDYAAKSRDDIDAELAFVALF